MPLFSLPSHASRVAPDVCGLAPLPDRKVARTGPGPNFPQADRSPAASIKFQTMKEQIAHLLGQKNYVPANVPELLELLGLRPGQQQELQETLRDLERAGQIARIKGNRYILPREADLIPGRIRMNRAGQGLSPARRHRPQGDRHPGSRDRHRPARGSRAGAARCAAKGPASRAPPSRTPARWSASWNAVAPRSSARCNAAGSFSTSFPMTRASRMTSTCRNRATSAGRRASGDKVVVELREWESRHTNPEGEIIEVLGAPDAEGVDMLSVLRQYDLPLHFPKPVLHEAHAIGTTVAAATIWPGAWIAAGTRSSPLTPTTRRISTTRSAWNASHRNSGGSGFTSPTCRTT